ncbi:MAG: RHS repeat-associated core domain-containing protein, partial [Candidatus Methanosuratincola sp.]
MIHHPFQIAPRWHDVAPYRFTGQREEAALGLYFYNARWYDPALGRFLSPNSIAPEAGNPPGCLAACLSSEMIVQSAARRPSHDRYRHRNGGYLST